MSLTSHSTQYSLIGHFGDGGPEQWCAPPIQ